MEMKSSVWTRHKEHKLISLFLSQNRLDNKKWYKVMYPQSEDS